MISTSSVIRSVDYNIGTKDLNVELQSGARYCYHDVPSKIHSDFIAASSAGKFFNTCIKGKFTVTKLSTSEGEDPMKITVDSTFLSQFQDILTVHIATLRMQKQRIVSELAFVDEGLESAGTLADAISKKLSTKPESKKSPVKAGELTTSVPTEVTERRNEAIATEQPRD